MRSRNPASFPDETWRIICREIASGIDATINGKDCYVFARKGGQKPTDIWSIAYQPVEKFWTRNYSDPKAVDVDRYDRAALESLRWATRGTWSTNG
jgi:hypothetical protein